MRIGILYIALGNYHVFFDDFYHTSEKYLLANVEKYYYVFTDYKEFDSKKYPNVRFIEYENLGWPYNTLMRFHMFYSIKEEIIDNDYLFFFNANALFVTHIEADILPDEEHNNLVGAIHPGYRGMKPEKYPYERNKCSAAYISYDEGEYYFQGCFFGGKQNEFIKLTEYCMNNIDYDMKNGIMAVWHDESHLNRYFIDFKPKVLDSNYIFPEDLPLKNMKVMILMRDKRKYGGHNPLRGIRKGIITSIIKRIFHQK